VAAVVREWTPAEDHRPGRAMGRRGGYRRAVPLRT
jgi:hypothetical protein